AGRGASVMGPGRLGAVRLPARPDRLRAHREPGEGAGDVDAGARGHAPARRRVRFVLSSVPVGTAVPRRGAGAAHRADEVTRRAVDHHRGRGGQAYGVAEAGPAHLPAAGPVCGRLLGKPPVRLTSPPWHERTPMTET